MVRKATLEEAQDVLSEHTTEAVHVSPDRVYQNHDGSFNVADFGRMSSHMTYVVPETFDTDKSGDLRNPLRWYYCTDFTENMGIDFGTRDIQVIFGDFSFSRNNRPVFEIKPAEQANDILLKIDDDTYDGLSITNKDLENAGALCTTTFNRYQKYAVFPVDYSGYNGDIPIKDILKDYQTRLDHEQAEIDQEYHWHHDAKESTMEKIQPLIDEIQHYNPEVEVTTTDVEIIMWFPESWNGLTDSFYFSQIEAIESLLERKVTQYREIDNDKKILTENGIEPALYENSQIIELGKGFSDGLSAEDVKIYADPKLKAYVTQYVDFHDMSTWLPDDNSPPSQMAYYRNQLENGTDREIVRFCTDHHLEPSTASFIIHGLQAGVDESSMEFVLKGKYKENQQFEIVHGLENGVSIDRIEHYFDRSFSDKQMEQIRLGFEHGLSDTIVKFYSQDLAGYGYGRYNEDVRSASVMAHIRIKFEDDKTLMAEHGMDPDRYHPLQILAFGLGVSKDISDAKLEILTNSDFVNEYKSIEYNWKTLETVCDVLGKDISDEDAKIIADPIYTAEEIEALGDAVESGVPIDEISVAMDQYLDADERLELIAEMKSDYEAEKADSNEHESDAAQDTETNADNDNRQDDDEQNDSLQEKEENDDSSELSDKLADIKNNIIESVDAIVSNEIDGLIKELNNDVDNDAHDTDEDTKNDSRLELDSNNDGQDTEQSKDQDTDDIDKESNDIEYDDEDRDNDDADNDDADNDEGSGIDAGL